MPYMCISFETFFPIKCKAVTVKHSLVNTVTVMLYLKSQKEKLV